MDIGIHGRVHGPRPSLPELLPLPVATQVSGAVAGDGPGVLKHDAFAPCATGHSSVSVPGSRKNHVLANCKSHARNLSFLVPSLLAPGPLEAAACRACPGCWPQSPPQASGVGRQLGGGDGGARHRHPILREGGRRARASCLHAEITKVGRHALKPGGAVSGCRGRERDGVTTVGTALQQRTDTSQPNTGRQTEPEHT